MSSFALGEGSADFLDDFFDTLGFDMVQHSGSAEVVVLLNVGEVDGTFGSGGSGIEESAVTMTVGSDRAKGEVEHDLVKRTEAKAIDQLFIVCRGRTIPAFRRNTRW